MTSIDGRPVLFKRPGDTRLLTIDVSGKIAGTSVDSITHVESTHLKGGPTTPAALTITQVAQVEQTIEFYVAGGSDGAFYLVEAEYTSGSETLESTFILAVTTDAEAG